MSYYNDNLDPEDQVDAEEALASILFDELGQVPSEEDCAEVSKKLLLWVLERFRPDLCEPPHPRAFAPLDKEA